MTPSKRRKMGRDDFIPGVDPKEIAPYKKDAWGYDIYMRDYLDGWKEAEKNYYADLEEEEAREPDPLEELEERIDFLKEKVNYLDEDMKSMAQTLKLLYKKIK